MKTGLWLRDSAEGAVFLPFLAEVRSPGAQSQVVPVRSHKTEPNGAIVIDGTSQDFTAQLRIGPPEGQPTRRDARLSISALQPAGIEAAISVECHLGTTTDPGWLVPGLFYQQNRAPDCTRLYPRFTTDHPDSALLESSSWSFRADRAATPAVFAWDDNGGAAVACSETGALGENGVGFALVDGKPVLRLHFPFSEEPVSYDGSATPRPAVRATAHLSGGSTVELDFSLYLLSNDRHSYAAVLRQMSEQRSRPGAGSVDEESPAWVSPAWVSIDKAAELAAWGLYRWHYRETPAVLLETAAFDREALGARGDRQAMHVSWVSGVPYAYALLRHASRCRDQAYAQAAIAVIDNVAEHLAPGGTFWGQWDQARGWTTGWSSDPDRLHARTLADAALFLLRALVHEDGHGARHPAWEAALRSNLSVVTSNQRADGALGAAYAASDGRVLDWRGSAGLAWVAPLAEAGAALSEPGLVVAARRAGEYYANFVESEYLCGAPEDVDLAPTSEDGYLALMSFMALYRVEGGARWLELAKRSADWMLTFRYTYDVSFSPGTLLGRYGFRTLGADQASPSNQHLHNFGLICLPELAELSAALGDGYYRERQRETLACFRQFIAREDGDFNAYRGMVSERFYQTTCFQAKGMLLTLSHAWCVGVLLLACEEAIASGQDWEQP